MLISNDLVGLLGSDLDITLLSLCDFMWFTGDKIYDVNLEASPPTHTEAKPIPFKHVDTATCNEKGVSVVVDDDYYHYESPAVFITSRIQPVKHDVAKDLLGCDHHVWETEKR